MVISFFAARHLLIFFSRWLLLRRWVFIITISFIVIIAFFRRWYFAIFIFQVSSFFFLSSSPHCFLFAATITFAISYQSQLIDVISSASLATVIGQNIAEGFHFHIHYYWLLFRGQLRIFHYLGISLSHWVSSFVIIIINIGHYYRLSSFSWPRHFIDRRLQ